MLKNLVQIKCKNNRSTFYANYLDIYDLAEKVVKRIEEEMCIRDRYNALEQKPNKFGILASLQGISTSQSPSNSP